jgi:hypothetical protein
MRHPVICGAVLSCAMFLGMGTLAAEEAKPESAAAPTSKPASRPAPKAISENVKKGLAYLVANQLPSGAWGQGDESREMGNALDAIKASPNVADTCMAVMAILRGGSTPREGQYQDHVLKGIGFVCDQVEAADAKDLYVTSLRGTRTQTKLGAYVDTFMAAQLLAEVKNQMPDAVGTKRVAAALAKVIGKIEANQQADGRFAGGGWAPVLAQGQAAKAMNVAVQNGQKVNEGSRFKLEAVAQADFENLDASGGSSGGSGGSARGEPMTLAGGTLSAGSARAATSPSAGDAGVELYSRASQVAAMQSSANTNAQLRERYAKLAASPTTAPADRKAASDMLARFDQNDKDLAHAQSALVVRLQDKQFVAGFGSNGGEEFLSYLDIGESLILKGGADWDKWDKSITDNLNRIQNADGSWSGAHCITGRTFCTAAALSVLTIDRAPVPMAADIVKVKGRQ